MGPDPGPAALVAAREALSLDPVEGLRLDGVGLAGLAARHGTPLWVYGGDTLARRYARLAAALEPARIHYAVKANDHLALLARLGAAGAGADVVSGGELGRAQAAGIAPERIVFSGVGKTRDEIDQALAAGIGQFNVESAEELAMLAARAAAAGRVAPVALRMNPDVDAGTHDKISTGRAGDKFGIAADEVAGLYAQAAAARWLRPVGLALHIGSQIGRMAPYRAAFARAAALVRALRAQGLAVARMDCGGGLAIAYRDEIAASPDGFAQVLHGAFDGLALDLLVEPGRWLVGPVGVLVARVVRVKESGGRVFVVLDAAMTELLRPALYGSWHGVVPVAAAPFGQDGLAADGVAVDLVGPVCESSDVLARGRLLPALGAEDLVAVLDAGAYGAVMSSSYNARPRAAQILVEAGRAHLITPRQTLRSLWQDERVPPYPAA